MSFSILKSLSKRTGLYRSARWANRHVINRRELRDFTRELQFYRSFIEPGSLCFDVGANYGWKTEVFLNLGCTVIACEPQTECMRELNDRLSPNDLLHTEETAVGAEVGNLTLHIMNHRTNSSLLTNWKGTVVGSISVPVTTLDKLITKHGVPHFCKIDVEGYELEVLKGLTQKIPILSFEYHANKEGIPRAIACLDYLEKLGHYSINISPAETPAFTAHTPWTKAKFIEFLRDHVVNLCNYGHGDIYIIFDTTVNTH